MPRNLILASASPRRAELLGRLGMDFTVKVSDFAEKQRPGEKPIAYALRNAEGKGLKVAESLGAAGKNTTILSADTIVLVDEQVLEKPVDEADARRMIKLMSGRGHKVLTSVSFIEIDSHGKIEIAKSFVVSTDVYFRKVWDFEIDRYVQTPEPYDKSGAYGISQGATQFIEKIEGSFTSVMGLPLAECCTYLIETHLNPN